MARVSEISSYQSPWLKAEDLAGAPRRVRIADAKVETLPQSDGSKAPKIILAFHGKQKKLILNTSQASALVTALGDDTERWLSAEIILSPLTSNNGQPTIGLAVIPTAPEIPTTAPEKTENPFW